MKNLRRLRQEAPFHKVRNALRLYVLLLSSAQVLAQSSCGSTTQTQPIRVENATGVDILRTAVSCTGSGEVEAYWAGNITVDLPIAVAEGTFLSVTGDDDLAEIRGGASETNGTRLFEVSQGGGLALARIRLSGGCAWGGGAIYSRSAQLTLDNCTFDGNVATDGSGGAVWADGGNVTIVGGAFLGNQATRYGGAVHAADGNLSVQGQSRFEGNKAIAGGALYCGRGDLGAGTLEVVCSILDATFVGNSAARDDQEFVDELSHLDGGGAVMILYATTVDITDSTFTENYARLTGGALYGGQYSNISVNGCRFDSNTAERYGGAIYGSTMTLGGSTQLTNNTALDDGGAVFGWHANGTIVFNNVSCAANTAINNGGCFYGLGRGIFNNDTAMLGNEAVHGASILASEGSDILVRGGTFTGGVSKNGGFIYANDESRVTVTGGLIQNNVATKRGGALYCNGNVASDILIEGGLFLNNKALESGGAIALWGDPTVVKITGGTFANNHAIFYGGFAYIEVGSSLECDGATVRNNQAGDQGGGIYAREATWVNSSCSLIANESPQGAAIYLTNVKSATFENHTVANNLAAGGSVVYVAASSVVARQVSFESSVDLQEYSFNRAIQLDGNTTLAAEQCVFDGWEGDTVIFNSNAAAGSLVLNSCDFSGSSAVMAVISPNSDAEIRNAIVSSFTFENAVAGTVNKSLTLVDRALDCGASNACGVGDCVDSALGVLCECLEGGECLNDGGELSLHIKTRPADETYSPDMVSYELVVSSASNGTTCAIWDLDVNTDYLSLDLVPSSGILPPNGTVTVKVSGAPVRDDVSGNLSASFNVITVGNSSSTSTVNTSLGVSLMFYLCQAYEYADTVNGDINGKDGWCEQCVDIEDSEAVNCSSPGATLPLLPVRQGYWRSNSESLDVHKCLHSEACRGATSISDSDDYCEDEYMGPYCAVCKNEYGRDVSNTCYSCGDTRAHLLVAMGVLFCMVLLLLFVLAVVFLVGGLDAIDVVRHTLRRTFSEAGSRLDSLDSTAVVPAFDFVLARKSSKIGPRCTSSDKPAVPFFPLVPCLGGKGGTDHRSIFTTANCSEPGASDQTHTHHLGAMVGAGVEMSEMTARQDAPVSAVTENVAVEPQKDRGVEIEASSGGQAKGGGFGKKVKQVLSRLPLDKLKILVVVWQILTVCSSITGVEYPAFYSSFLSWINIVNLDIGNIFSVSCVLPHVNFYARVLVATLAPLILGAVLVLTYHMAKHRAGIGSPGVTARRAAWSRHVAAGLLLTFLVFTSTSTLVFETFACDQDPVEGESYLRADYNLSCDTYLHMWFKIYAGLMILVYPIGIPAVYAAILWKNRELLNPRIHITTTTGVDRENTGIDPANGDDVLPTTLPTKAQGTSADCFSSLELQELSERIKARRVHPELVPSMFLWKDFGPDLYYYEVIECGRRMLLTGVLVFIAPHSPTQVAIACIFAFASLLGFELMRPHMDAADCWLYRLGCVIIFLSNFLALLIKVDAGGETSRDAFGGVMVAVNVLLVLAVIVTSWFAVQQCVDDSVGEDSSLTVAKAMLTAEQYAAHSARRERSAGAPTSSVFFSARNSVPASDPPIVDSRENASHERHRSGVTVAISDDVMSGFARGRGINADTLDKLQHHSQQHIGGSGPEEC